MEEEQKIQEKQEEQKPQKEQKSNIRYQLVCNGCGVNKIINSMMYARLISKYDTDEEVVKNYKCKNCKKTA